jgi:hypothetical protein
MDKLSALETSQELQWKCEMILARPRVKLAIGIRSKLSLYPYRYFTERLVDVFRKQPFKGN